MRITHGSVTNQDTGIQRVEFNNELITNVLIAENEEFHIFEDGISLNQSFSLLPDSQKLKQDQ